MHTITTTRGAVQLLLSALSQPGWSKSAPSLYRAGKIVDDLEMKFNEEAPKDVAEQKEWTLKSAVFTLTEKERDTVKDCILHHIKEGHLAPSKHYRSLADALGMQPTDED